MEYACHTIGYLYKFNKLINKQNFKRLYYMTSDVLSTALADRKNIIDDYYNKSLINYNNLSDYKDKILLDLMGGII